jgi:dUTPase
MSALQYARTEPIPREQNPSRATRGSVGLDLFLPASVTIQPLDTAAIDLKVTFRFPPLVYGQLHLRSSSSLLGIELVGGVIGKKKKYYFFAKEKLGDCSQTTTTEDRSSPMCGTTARLP